MSCILLVFAIIYYIVLEIYMDRCFLKDGCYFQQTISAVAKEYLISYNLIQRAPETQKPYTKSTRSTKLLIL